MPTVCDLSTERFLATGQHAAIDHFSVVARLEIELCLPAKKGISQRGYNWLRDNPHDRAHRAKLEEGQIRTKIDCIHQ